MRRHAIIQPRLVDSLIRFFIVSSLIVIPLTFSFSQDYSKSKQLLRIAEKSAQTNIAAILNINKFTIWQQGHGRGAYPPTNSGDGGIYPRGTRWVLFADGFVWAAKAFLDAAHSQPASPQLIRVGGSTYNVGNQIGWIEGFGPSAQAVSSNDPRARIYRIRRDWMAMSEAALRQDAAENLLRTTSDISEADIAALKAQYRKDWDEWPVELGAPYVERNGIPGYQKPPPFSNEFNHVSLLTGNYDEPGLAGADPDAPADQVIWCVFNDLNRGNMIGFAGSEPMGLEMQLTLWGYNRPDPLGSMYFKRLRMINKGGADVGGGAKGSLYLDSVFVAKWSDPDVGAFGDDLVGCDTLLEMGFAYNGNPTDAEFIKFNLPPPAVGYDLLQGPIVPSPGDTGTFDFIRQTDQRNLPLLSFTWLAAGFSSEEIFNYEGALRWWRQLQGYVRDPSTSPMRLYPHPPGVPETRFPLSGDPVTQTGFVDGLGTTYSFSPGDRRMTLSSGPFRLSPGDTQEVIVAVIAGLGADRLSSISVMKSHDLAAQAAHDNLFSVARPPRRPHVNAIALNGEIILEWGSEIDNTKATEQTVVAGDFAFEGYTVYQLPSAQSRKSEAIRIATFDRVNDIRTVTNDEFDIRAGVIRPVVQQLGTDSGIRRSIRISRDALTGDLLRNGTEYFFAVTAYNVSPNQTGLRTLENDFVPVRIRPRIPFGITGYRSYGDVLPVEQIQGSGTGTITVKVINPLASTGDFYEVSFDSTAGTLRWTLRNLSRQTLILTDQPLHAGSDDPPIVEGGVSLRVEGTFTSSDVFRYGTPQLNSGLALEKQGVERITVFPNPAVVESHVTFTNLPGKAVITIYNLSGHLIRTLRKDDPSQYFEWNLRNERNWQVGSGVYICLIELPDLQEAKILKVAVIQPQLYPNMR